MTFKFTVNFAVILSFISMVVSFSLWIWERRNNRTRRKIDVYEEIFEDVCFILEVPLHKRRDLLKENEYINADNDIQEGVRKYINSHWMEQMWGAKKFIPSHLTTEKEKHAFIRKVIDEAHNYQDKISSYVLDISIPEQSPVYYIDESHIKRRFEKITNHVGHNLSYFSDNVKDSWERIRFYEASEIKNQYEKALKICSNFFEQNPRDFDDPFYDLLVDIRKEYRSLTRKKLEIVSWQIYKFRLLFHRLFKVFCFKKKD